MRAIVDGAARKTEVNTRGGQVRNFDPEPLANLLEAVSTLSGEGSAKEKARLFEMGANKITQIRDEANSNGVVPFGLGTYYGQPAEDLIRNSLTKILDSDTTGVMTQMETLNRKGKGMTAYIKSMINSGEKDQLATFINRLQRGNDLSQNPIENFTKKTTDAEGNEYFRNASIMGYFTGSIISATEQITGDRTKQAEIIKGIFGNVLSLADAGKGGTVIGAASSQIVNDITERLNKGNIELAEALTELTYPRTSNGEPYEGSAERDYDIAVGRVLDRLDK